PTASVSSAGSPFTHTPHVPRTAENPSPHRSRAWSSTAATVSPATTSVAVPAASRAWAKRRTTGTDRAYSAPLRRLPTTSGQPIASAPVTQLLVIRHGQSEWNADGRWQGQENPPLTNLGRQQARTAARAVGAI